MLLFLLETTFDVASWDVRNIGTTINVPKPKTRRYVRRDTCGGTATTSGS